MKPLFTLILLSVCLSGVGQSTTDISIFHRLIIYNASNEIMLVNIKNTEVWVTPGFYQDNAQFIKEGLHAIAATYGMEIADPELKGMFSMRRAKGDGTEMLIRNIYHCNYKSGEIHFPENQSFEIGEIKWLPIQEAIALISFESIGMFMKQTHEHPDKVWGGSITALRENGKLSYKIEEEFYPLFNSTKRKGKKKRKKD